MDRADSLRTDFVTEYAQAVVDGVIIAGPHVRDACKRHLKDLLNAPERGFFFDLEKAYRVVEFFKEVLCLNGGDFEGVAYDPLPWQKFILGSLFGWVKEDGKRRYRMAFIETSKGPLALDTPIATVNGWSNMGALKIGDYVFDDQGKPTKVVGVSDIFYQRDCYKLTFSDGSSIVADADHKWETTCLRNGQKPGHRKDLNKKGLPFRRTTEEIYRTLSIAESSSKHPQAKWNHRIELAPALVLPDIELPIAPYTLGVWLGDGDNDGARITTEDEEITKFIEDEGYLLGSKSKKHNNNAWRQTIGVRDKAVCIRGHGLEHRNKKNRCLACDRETETARRHNRPFSKPTQFSLKEILRGQGLLYNKHIPRIYFRSGTSQRLSLLQGIMDTDGYISHNGSNCEITLCNKNLIHDIKELLIGLGFKCTVRESDAQLNGRVVGRRWRIGFKAYSHFSPFRLNRKKSRLPELPHTRPPSLGRMIVGCEPTASIPVRCITVEANSHLFLAGKGLIKTCNSGKSPLAAGIGLYGLMADGEARAEVYAAAAKKEQAMILFRDAVAMAELAPELSSRLIKSGRGEEAWNLAYPETGSYFRPISSDNKKSGNRPHVTLLDEIHEHKDGTVIEMMRAGTKGRRQALIFMITNSGHDRNSVCWKYHEYGIQIASGQLEDDAFFSYVCGLDENEDPFLDENCWIKTNPSLGITIQREYLIEQITQARGMPSKESLVRRLNFCQWVGAESPWISAEVWFDNREDYPLEQLYGRRCFGGLDLSSTQDLTALILLFEPDDTDPFWRLLPFFWLPALGLDDKGKRDGVDYLTWVRQGHLETTPGKAIDKAFVLQRLAEVAADYDLQTVGYDRWRIEDLKNMANNDGIDINFQPFGQGFKDMAPAVDEFERRLLAGELKHDGNPVMTWCAANAVVATDPAGNRKPTKQKSTGRIDGVVAAVMAVGQTLGADKGNIDDFLNDPVMSAA